MTCIPACSAVCKDPPPHSKPQMWKGYLAIAGGMLVHLTLGTIYTSGNMAPYIISYLREYSDTPGVRLKDSVWIHAVGVIGQGIGVPIGGILYVKLGARWATLIGSLTQSVGVGVTFFTIKHSIWLCLLSYSLMFGIGMGIGYAPPFTCAMKWMPARKGLVTGLVLAGFGGGAFVFNQVQTAFLNSNNLSPDTPLYEGSDEMYFSQPAVLELLPSCFLMLAGCYVVAQSIGVLILFSPPEEKAEAEVVISVSEEDESHELVSSNKPIYKKPTKSEKERPLSDNRYDLPRESVDEKDKMLKEKTMIETAKRIEGMSILEMIKTRSYWTLWFTLLLNAQCAGFISAIYKAFGQSFIRDDQFLAIVGSCAAVFNAIGRPIWGYLGDRFTYRITMMVLTSLMGCLFLTFEATMYGGKPMYIIWVCLLYFAFCGNYSLLPACTARMFGATRVGQNYGVVFTGAIIASLIGGIIPSQLKDAIGWHGLFMLTAAMAFLSFLLSISFNGRDANGKEA